MSLPVKSYARFFYISCIIAMSIILGLPAITHAVGVSPGTIRANNLANGVRIPKVINVSRTETEKPQYFLVEAQGEDARYLDLPTTEFVMEAGQNQYAFEFFIVPVAAQNGDHEASLRFVATKSPEDLQNEGTSAVAIISAARTNIEFEIVDHEVKAMQISGAWADPTEVNIPPTFGFSMMNLGNVDVRPDRVEIALVDTTDSSHIINETVTSENIELVGPGISKNVGVAMTQNVPLGKYHVSISFFLNGEELYSHDSLILFVHPPGTLAQQGDFESFELSQILADPGELVLITASIKNSGQLKISPTLYVQIKKDGKVVDLLRSEQKEVGKGLERSYDLSFRPQERGHYIVDGHFEYGVKETEHKQLSLAVSPLPIAKIAIIGGGILLIIILIIILIKRRKSEKKKPVKKNVTTKKKASPKKKKKK